jgi:hypothetical protein
MKVNSFFFYECSTFNLHITVAYLGATAPPGAGKICFRAFPVAAAKIWNSLPSDITSAETLRIFKNRLKTFLFAYPMHNSPPLCSSASLDFCKVSEVYFYSGTLNVM